MRINSKLGRLCILFVCMMPLFSSCVDGDSILAQAAEGAWYVDLEAKDEDGFPIRKQLTMQFRCVEDEDGWIYGGTFLERNRYSQSVQDSGIRANYSATTEISGTWEVLMGDLYLTYNLNSLEVKVGDVDLQVNDWDYEMQMFMDEYKGDFRREIYSETYRESRRNYKEANDYEGAFENLEIEGNRLSFLSGDAGRVTLRKLKE